MFCSCVSSSWFSTYFPLTCQTSPSFSNIFPSPSQSTQTFWQHEGEKGEEWHQRLSCVSRHKTRKIFMPWRWKEGEKSSLIVTWTASCAIGVFMVFCICCELWISRSSEKRMRFHVEKAKAKKGLRHFRRHVGFEVQFSNKIYDRFSSAVPCFDKVWVINPEFVHAEAQKVISFIDFSAWISALIKLSYNDIKKNVLGSA